MSLALIVAQREREREREVTNVRPFDSPEAFSRPQAPLAAKSFYFLKSSPFPDFEAFVFLHLQICRVLEVVGKDKIIQSRIVLPISRNAFKSNIYFLTFISVIGSVRKSFIFML